MERIFLQICCIVCLVTGSVFSQGDTIVIGFGGFHSTGSVTSSDNNADANNVIEPIGYLPNENAASRFLEQATMGFTEEMIETVSEIGVEAWIDQQLGVEKSFDMIERVQYWDKIQREHFPDRPAHLFYWRGAWFDYHMRSEDHLRQRVAYALSEIIVVSELFSSRNTYGLTDYYDMLLENAFGNYRTLLEEVTYTPTMANYLTYRRNRKGDPSKNRFPDENYAREIMQLFTIGLYQLNDDGSYKMNADGSLIPTYDNYDIAELSKVFTGFNYGDQTSFWGGRLSDTSELIKVKMFNNYHEPGDKVILRNDTIHQRAVTDGDADVKEAIDILFNHPNVPPFVSYRLIQRLTTSNPSPKYLNDISQVFKDNGAGVRGDLGAVVKAILMHEEARSCQATAFNNRLSEPFLRYMHLAKMMQSQSKSGFYRNYMNNVYRGTQQAPLRSLSVFNFFSPFYQPAGPIKDKGLSAPEFEITDFQTIFGYMNFFQEVIFNNNIADVHYNYQGEPDSVRRADVAVMDYEDYVLLTDDNMLHILIDRLNRNFAAGRLTKETAATVVKSLQEMPILTYDDNIERYTRELRFKMGLLCVLSSPEYLIK